MQTFASSIEEHPLLVYLSALPFTPVNTLLYKTYADDDVPWIVGGYNRSWPALLQIFRGYNAPLTTVAFTPDGTQIVSSHWFGQIRVWDASSGAQILAPFTENERRVTHINSVAVSPDGTRIASASHDKTISLWDMKSGEELWMSVQGHTAAVLSLAFAPSGTQIASCCNDQTVRLWDATSGCQVLSPLYGHTNVVAAVKFSPDGSQIMSGSYDKTIRVWDPLGGAAILKPFQG